MNRALLGLTSMALAWMAGAQDSATTPKPAGDLADRCDTVVATISEFYSASFAKIVARKIPRESFSVAMTTEMKKHFAASDIEDFGDTWEEHFSAVGDQLAPELIEGYIHYQCRTDTFANPIRVQSDAIDAGCWDTAHEGKTEILDARMRLEDSTDLKRLSRAKILACITMSLARPSGN